MNKKVLCLGLAASALFSSCKKDNNPVPDFKKTSMTTSAQTLQGAVFII